MAGFYGEPTNPYYTASSGGFNDILSRAIRGFGATTISGSGGTGKTTLATALTSMASRSANENGILLPHEFSSKGYSSTELDLFLVDFLAVFFSPGVRSIAFKAVSSEEEQAIRATTDELLPYLKESVKIQAMQFLGNAQNPRTETLRMAYSLWAHIIDADPSRGVPEQLVDEELNRKIQAHVNANGVQPSDDELKRMGATTEQANNLTTVKGVSIPSVDKIDSDLGDMIDSIASTEVLLSWLVSYPTILHSIATSPTVITSLRHVGEKYAKALNAAFGHAVVIRNEKKPRATDLEVSIDAEDPTLAYFSFLTKDISASGAVRATPLRVARGLAFAFIVHISTLNDAYAQDIQSTTLSGGMSTGITDAIQALNDRGADAGARFFIETRDDFTPKGASGDEVALFEDRFMSSSRVSLYLKSKGSGRWRTRKYSELDPLEQDARDDFSFDFDRDIKPHLEDETVAKQDAWDALIELQEEE